MRYAELQCTTHFSFLRGASSCDELFRQANALGIDALGIADRNSLAGMVRALVASRETGVRLVVGCRLDLQSGTSLLVYPKTRAGYGRLCRLLSLGKTRSGKGGCDIAWADLELYAEDWIAILLPDEADDKTALDLRRLKDLFADDAYLALTLRRRPNDRLRLADLNAQAFGAGVKTVVTNDVLFHTPDRRMLQDIVTCIRHNCTIDDVGFRRERHADRYLKPPEEMFRLYSKYPEAVRRSIDIMEKCRFSLEELVYQYPDERSMPGLSAQEALAKLTWEGTKMRYPEGLPDKVRGSLEHELGLIARMEYAPYFLTVHAIVRFARTQGILCQGRGSAANSAVCYVLGITNVDPDRNDLLFERFVSEERGEPPDIDVDFEHERREEVIQWIYKTYGRECSALTASVRRYRPKSALLDVGKALGLPEDLLRSMSKEIWGWSREDLTSEQFSALNLSQTDYRLRLTLELATQLLDAPRHFSQHPGGFVLTRDRLDEMVPIEPAAMQDRQIIEWDKDDIDVLKFMKMDVLGLGMLTCMKRAFNFLEEAKGISLDMATIPPEDPRTYAMIRKAQTLGTFQIESRAQMSMLPHLRPFTFYDLVIQVAIVRPGPIQGDMVHPYLRRRQGKETVTYPTPELDAILSKTLGVPLFQEQAMKVAIQCAGFTPGQADQLRRAMATFKHTGGVSKFGQQLIDGMLANGYDRDFAERTFKQLEGFGSYGFPESHAYSFALIAYASAWMKCWHPDVFCAALINSQPMGFYAPPQIVADAQKNGVEIRPICINASRWDCTLEPTPQEGRFAVRLGMRLVKHLANIHVAAIVAARDERPYSSIEDIRRRAAVPVSAIEKLGKADAFRSLAIDRPKAVWSTKALRDDTLPLFEAAARLEGTFVPEVNEPVVELAPMTAGAEVVEDYAHTGLTLRQHPVSFLRYEFEKSGYTTCQAAMAAKDKKYVQVAGMVLVRQRPGSANGVTFITIEDETGIANVIVWQKTFEALRPVVLSAHMLLVSGQIQREGEVTHLIARHLVDLSQALATVGDRDAPFPLPHGRGDELHRGTPPPDPRGKAKMPAARDMFDTPYPRSVIGSQSRDFR